VSCRSVVASVGCVSQRPCTVCLCVAQRSSVCRLLMGTGGDRTGGAVSWRTSCSCKAARLLYGWLLLLLRCMRIVQIQLAELSSTAPIHVCGLLGDTESIGRHKCDALYQEAKLTHPTRCCWPLQFCVRTPGCLRHLQWFHLNVFVLSHCTAFVCPGQVG
jgi:hypothetical protein